MRSYTITIAPDDLTQATTTLRVQVSGASARITELLVRAGKGDGISAGQLPSVDLEQLVRAVVPATTSAKVITDTAPAAPQAPAEAAIPPVPAAPTRPGRQVATAAKSATPAGAEARAPKSTAKKSAKRAAKKTAAATSSDSGRTYRRAPEDLETVLRQAGTAAAVADHYGVPKHTAYGWIRKLRSKDTVKA